MFEKENTHYVCYVTKGLVAVNMLVFLLFEVLGSNLDTMFMLEHGAMFTPYLLVQTEWYRLFTSMFLHFGIRHLLNNMLLLYVLGDYLEKYLGRVKFLLLYVIAGVGANIVSGIVCLWQNDVVVSAGASGAVFGILGGLLWVILRNKGRVENLTIKKMTVMAVLSLYYGFVSEGVDNVAHVTGLILGFVLAILFYRKKSAYQQI